MSRLRRCIEVVGGFLRRSGARLGAIGAVTILALFAAMVSTLVAPGHAFGTSEPALPQGPADAVAGQPAEAASAGTVLVTLPWGDGDDQVGLLTCKEGLTRGPEALAVSPDGRIALLDSVNHRLVLLDERGRALRKIALQLAEPRFLAVDDQILYVLDADGERKLATFTWSGRAVTTVPLPMLDDVVTGLFATSDGACVEIAHRTSLLLGGAVGSSATASSLNSSRVSQRELAGRPLDRDMRQIAKATYNPKDGVRIRTGTIDSRDLEITGSNELRPILASGRAIEHLVSVDSDGHGGLLVGARLFMPEAPDSAKGAIAVTRLASDMSSGVGQAGQVKTAEGSVLLLAESSFAYLGQPYAVAPDGRIFQPIGSKQGYTLVVHTLAEAQP
jgi:hypothetical protein